MLFASFSGLALAVPWFLRLVTAEAWFDSRACPWGFVMENVHWDRFCSSASVFSHHLQYTNQPHSSSF
jgi:hypothetical protein